MEDPKRSVFRKTRPGDVVFAKQVIPEDQAQEIHRDLLVKFPSDHPDWQEGAIGIARGIRHFVELAKHVTQCSWWSGVKDQLIVVLGNYLGYHDLCVSDDVRFYRHQFGEVKRHTDGTRDGSQYSLLLYLSDDFEGGTLSVRVPRDPLDRQSFQPEMGHQVFSFLHPRPGWAVVFSKNLIHFADCVETGSKDFLLIHLKSPFYWPSESERS